MITKLGPYFPDGNDGNTTEPRKEKKHQLSFHASVLDAGFALARGPYWPARCQPSDVKDFNWNDEKNARLKRERGITFDEVVFHIEHGGLLATIEHQDTHRFANQRLFVVRIGNYTYLVPFVETENDYFLKTIIPSRKASRRYVGKGEKND